MNKVQSKNIVSPQLYSGYFRKIDIISTNSRLNDLKF